MLMGFSYVCMVCGMAGGSKNPEKWVVFCIGI